MGTKRNYSITKDKYRFNDDFMLNFDGIDDTVLVSKNYTFLNADTDFSILFSVNKTSNSNSIILDSRTSVSDGVAVEITNLNNISVYFGAEVYTTSFAIALNQFKVINIAHNKTTKQLKIFVGYRLVETLIHTSSNVSGTTLRIGRENLNSTKFYEGQLRDVALFDKQTIQTEVNYVYETGILDESLYEYCYLHLPLNHVALIDGLDRKMIDVVRNYNYAKTLAAKPTVTANPGIMTGWNDNDLGLNIGTSTFTAYADFYTKSLGQNFTGGGDSIIYKGKEIQKYGLKINGINQYLEVLNFNPTKEKGYTILCAFNKDTNTPYANTEMIYSQRDDQINRFEMFAGGSNTKIIEANTPQTVSQDIKTLDYDTTEILFTSIKCRNEDNIRDFEQLDRSFIGQINTYKTRDTNTLLTTNGFEDITETSFHLGRRGNNTLFFGGNIFYMVVYKGVLNDVEIKSLHNNGLLRQPDDISKGTQSELVLNVDFNNPFDDGGTLKFPDLSLSNNTIITNVWADLPTLEASKVEILNLI